MLRTVFVIALSIISTITAQACSIVERPWKEVLASANVVFVGTVESVDSSTWTKNPYNEGTFVVQRVLRGTKVGDHIKIQSTRSTCGLSFTKGQQWMILASGDPAQSHQGSGSYLLVESNGHILKEYLDFAGTVIPIKKP